MSIAGAGPSTADQEVTGDSFRNSYMKSSVNQLQLKGSWDASDQSSVDFGLNIQHVKNRTAYANVEQDSWGGATNAGDYPDSVWHPTTVSKYFGQMSGSNDPAQYQNWFTFNFPQVRGIAASVGNPANYLASANFDGAGGTDERTKENTTSLYGQYNRDWSTWDIPMNLSAGLRYEKTNVISTASVPQPTDVVMKSQNELDLEYGTQVFTTLKGGYHLSAAQHRLRRGP